MRVSEKELRGLINRLNKETGSPVEYRDPVTTDTNVGHFTLDCAYGGYSLNRISNKQGGVTDRYCYGRHTKVELYDRIGALLQGLELCA